MADEYKTYTTVGAKEDISDIISNISPTKTPFQTMCSSEKVHNTLVQWQEDSLRAVADAPVVEGAAYVNVVRAPTTMRSNYTQIFTDVFSVSGTNEVTSKYGRAKESAYQAAKAAAALKRDLEHAMVGIENAAAAGSGAVAREFAAATNQMASGNRVATGGVSTAPTEANLLTAIQNVWDEGAEPDVIMTTPTDALVIATFAAASGRTRDFAEGKRIVNVVDFYVSPFGQQKVVNNRFLRTEDTLILDSSMWVKLVLRPWTRETLAKIGDDQRFAIVGEFSLKNKNQASAAQIEKAAS